jgi:hypothetical protein
MTTTQQEFESFTQFVSARLTVGTTTPLDELFSEWWDHRHRDEDRAAVAASLADMEAGETGRPFAEFAAEFRKLNNLPESA